jgi:hypothetical protein
MILDENIKLAQNKNTPLEKLKELALDENVFVRATVAENPAIPLDWIIKFIEDKDPLVVSSALSNPSLSRSKLNEILSKTKNKNFIDNSNSFTSNLDEIL